MSAALIWLVGLLFLRRIYTPWLLTAALALLIGLDRELSLRKVGHQLLHTLPFLTLMALTLSISDGLPPSREALLFAGLLCSRVVTAVLIILALTGGKQTEDFIRTLAALKNVGFVVGGMFIRGYDRSERVYEAMQARCYNGVIPYEEAHPPTVLDGWKLAIAVLVMGSILFLERRGGL